MRSNGRPFRSDARRLFAFRPFLVCSLTIAVFLAPRSYAQSSNLVVAPIDPRIRVTLGGHHPSWASVQNDLGAVPGDLPVEQLAFVLARSPEQQQAFEQFLSAQ